MQENIRECFQIREIREIFVLWTIPNNNIIWYMVMVCDTAGMINVPVKHCVIKNYSLLDSFILVITDTVT